MSENPTGTEEKQLVFRLQTNNFGSEKCQEQLLNCSQEKGALVGTEVAIFVSNFNFYRLKPRQPETCENFRKVLYQ